MPAQWILTRKEMMTFVILLFGMASAASLAYSLYQNITGASYISNSDAAGSTQSISSICSVNANLTLPFDAESGDLQIQASQYATQADKTATYRGTGYISGQNRKYTIEQISNLNCALPTQDKDGGNLRSVVQVQATGTLTDYTKKPAVSVPAPLVLNLRYNPSGLPIVDSFTVLVGENTADIDDWFGESLQSTGGTLNVNQSAGGGAH